MKKKEVFAMVNCISQQKRRLKRRRKKNMIPGIVIIRIGAYCRLSAIMIAIALYINKIPKKEPTHGKNVTYFWIIYNIHIHLSPATSI